MGTRLQAFVASPSCVETSSRLRVRLSPVSRFHTAVPVIPSSRINDQIVNHSTFATRYNINGYRLPSRGYLSSPQYFFRKRVPLATATEAGDGDDRLIRGESLNVDGSGQGTVSSSQSELSSGSFVESEYDAAGLDYPSLADDSPRPDWAPKWLPKFFLEIPRRPLVQLAIMLPLYAIHLFIFSTKGYKLPKPLIPNSKKLFQSVGWDSVVGGVVSLAALAWRKFVMKSKPLVPSLHKIDNPPWKVPREAKRKIGQTTAFLVVAYLASGYGAVFIEGILFLLASYGVPLTIATTRAWKVLLGHFMWVYMGIRILRRLRPFFPPEGTWLRWKLKANWLWWAIGGYYVSALLFNFADVINQLVLPASLFEEESVVSKLINPENKDRVAMAIGSIGPCITAPVFEEVLYRGFLLPALRCFLPMWAAIPASSVLFALHHLNPSSLLPLTVLGFIWAVLYTQSRNLIVTILIHCMWNSRVFLGSLLGLGTFPDFE